MDEKKIETRKQELTELKQLRELFQYTYIIEDGLKPMEELLRWVPQPNLSLFIDILQAYKRQIIDDTFKAYPMNIDALNCRNWSVTVLGNLIMILSKYRKRAQDIEYRDDWSLRAELEKANKKAHEDPIQNLIQ